MTIITDVHLMRSVVNSDILSAEEELIYNSGTGSSSPFTECS